MTRTLTRALLAIVGVLVALFMVLPLLIVVPLSFNERASFAFPPQKLSLKWYENFFTDPSWASGLANSVGIGLLVMLVSVVIGTSAALGLARMGKRSAGIMRALFLSPLIIPGVIIAVGIYTMFLYGQLVGTVAGFVAAHTLFAVPYVIISVGASLANFDRRLLDASASLGAGPVRTFLLVTLPGILPGVAAGALIAFVISFDEVLASLFIQSPLLKTLPVQMFSSLTRDTDPTMAAASTLILTITSIVVVIAVVSSARKKKS
ncbi:ABC transporter permease [Leucobacter tenebrionis]|uniref:ABC transporter permease n=1 Tax=Leucobacter tenebrionis TaxID=2873270 RepID=UPI001CA75B17|nr:ABC transporter permease [Leucobacter tenebrionis]QZY51615.1 ABC transporter permease [Leucobacter tenebrionis]